MKPLRSSHSLTGDVDRLRHRLVDDGYLYLPGFLDPAEVLDVQCQLRFGLSRCGWLARPSSLKVSGQRRLRFTAESFTTVYPAVQAVEAFHRLAHGPALLTLTAELLGDDVFCHPAKVARLSPPGPPGGYFTRAHQDFVVLHVATDVLTGWISLSDCSDGAEGLRLIPGSHREGFLPTDPGAGGARPLYLRLASDDDRWASHDYRVGDVVVFHSLTVHAGGPNTTDALRISADVRYQRRREPLRAEFAHPHGWPRTPDWHVLCRGWRSREWVDLPPDVLTEPMPAGVAYGDFLSTLQAPPSRLLGEIPVSVPPDRTPGETAPCRS